MKPLLLHILQIVYLMLLMGFTAGFFWLTEKLVQLVDKMRAWIRWGGVLPGSILFAFMAIFPLHWIIRLLCDRDPDDRWFSPATGDIIENYANWFIIPFAFVFAGARIAPRGRLGVAVTLTVVVLLSTAFVIRHALFIDGYSIDDRGKFFGIGALLVLGLGSGIYGTVKRLES